MKPFLSIRSAAILTARLQAPRSPTLCEGDGWFPAIIIVWEKLGRWGRRGQQSQPAGPPGDPRESSGAAAEEVGATWRAQCSLGKLALDFSKVTWKKKNALF